MKELDAEGRKILLNYILSRIFTQEDLGDKLHEVTGRAEPALPVEEIKPLAKPPEVRFKALREKLESKDSDGTPSSE